MNKKQHLNITGLSEIIKLKASLKGLPCNIKALFPNLLSMKRPKSLPILVNIDYHWFAGFFSGEGCFFVGIYRSKIIKTGYYVKLCIRVGQH